MEDSDGSVGGHPTDPDDVWLSDGSNYALDSETLHELDVEDESTSTQKSMT